MGVDGRLFAPALDPAPMMAKDGGEFEVWRSNVRKGVLDTVDEFVTDRCAVDLRGAGVDIAADVLVGFVDGGKCLRSTFMFLGWLCGEKPSHAALRAAASLELLHAFALLQDDVMDSSPMRRGHASAHVQFARWHREHGLSGCSERFGESAAVLLGDLCLVWAEQMLRNSGVDDCAQKRAWPRYDQMRTELAVGQFADLVNDVGGLPTLDAVLEVARRKSGNYTVRRPLEIGAAMAGCGPALLSQLGGYGDAVGEAFQLRDDLLGIFGSPAITGKPAGADLTEHKATSVVVAAHLMAGPSLRRQLAELLSAPELDDTDVGRWRALIAATGAVQRIEDMIADRLRRASKWVDSGPLDGPVRSALLNMASVCAQRAA